MAYTSPYPGGWKDAPDPSTPINHGALQTIDDGTAAAHSRLDALVVAPERFGAVGDGVTDDAAAIQAAINYCNTQGHGWVLLQNRTYLIKTKLVVKEGVTLLGQRNHRSLSGATGSTILADTTLTTGWIIDTAAGAIGCGIDGVNVRGQQDGTANVLGGVRVNDRTYGVRVANIWCNGVTDPAIGFTGHPVAAIIDNCVIGNDSSGRTLTGPVGALHTAGTDHTFKSVEAARGPSNNTGDPGSKHLTYAGHWRCAIYVGCASSWFYDVVGEFGDCAYYLDGPAGAGANTFIGPRADYCSGHAYYNNGSSKNQFIGARVFGAGLDLACTYSGAYHTNGAKANKWTNFQLNTGTGIPVLKYGWCDATTGNSGADANELWQADISHLDVVGDRAFWADTHNAMYPSGAGPISKRPASRFMSGSTWFDTDRVVPTFSDGARWRDFAGEVAGNLVLPGGANGQAGDAAIAWQQFGGSCTVAKQYNFLGTTAGKLIDSAIYAILTATATAATQGYLEANEQIAFLVPVVAGRTYTAVVRSTAETQPANVSIRCRWRDVTNTVIVQDDAAAITGGGTNSTTARTTSYLQGCLAPTGAATLDVIVRFTRTGMAAGEQHNVNYLAVVPGAVTDYSHP